MRRIARSLALGPTPWTAQGALLGYAAAMVGALAVGTLADVVARGLFGGLSSALEGFSTGVRGAPPEWLLPLVLVVGLAGPAGEELLFRGLFQTRLVALLGRAPGILLASVLFGLAHRDPMHVGLAFVAGLFLGWLADRAGSIRPAIAAHAFNNLASLAEDRAGLRDPEGAAAVAVGALAALLLAASITVLSRLGPRPD